MNIINLILIKVIPQQEVWNTAFWKLFLQLEAQIPHSNAYHWGRLNIHILDIGHLFLGLELSPVFLKRVLHLPQSSIQISDTTRQGLQLGRIERQRKARQVFVETVVVEARQGFGQLFVFGRRGELTPFDELLYETFDTRDDNVRVRIFVSLIRLCRARDL